MIFPLVFLTSMLFAEPSVIEHCYNGDPKNRDLEARILELNDPLTLKVLDDSQPKKCEDNLLKKEIKIIQNIVTPSVKNFQIKKECIVASLKRQIKNQRISCVQGQKKTYSVNQGLSQSPCVSEFVADYIHKTVNLALACIKDNFEVDPEVFFKIINNESGFNFNVADREGVGIGQLVGISVTDLSTNPNGYAVLKQFLNNGNPNCEPFQKILEKEINANTISKVGSSKNYCQWTDAGEGIARNLMYSLSLLHMRRKAYLERNLNFKQAKNKEASMQNAIMISYGRGGLGGAIELNNRYRGNLDLILNTKPCRNDTCDEYSENEIMAYEYLNEINTTYSEMNEAREYSERGKSCIE